MILYHFILCSMYYILYYYICIFNFLGDSTMQPELKSIITKAHSLPSIGIDLKSQTFARPGQPSKQTKLRTP